MLTFDECIDCQKFAQLGNADYNRTVMSPGPIVYGITHLAEHGKKVLADSRCKVLVTTSSDASVYNATWLPKNIIKWFSTNVMCYDKRVEAIPIGFVFNSVRHLAIVTTELNPVKRNLMYMCFSRPKYRIGIYEMFEKYPWVTTKGGNYCTDVTPREFYADIAAHHFTLSPPGAGPDCHRHWEAMALGSIPIVLRSRATAILDDMPCLQVSSWNEITPYRLERALKDLLPRFTWPSMRKLEFSYWKERILACV